MSDMKDELNVQLLFVTLCVARRYWKCNVAEQVAISQKYVRNLFDPEDIHTCVFEMTKKGNVHWHLVIKCHGQEQTFFDDLSLKIHNDKRAPLFSPNREAVKFVWDDEYLVNTYLTKEEHNKPDQKHIPKYEVVYDSEEC